MCLPLLIRTSFANPCAAQAAEEETIFFERKIRPVLVEHCYECHGNDSDNIKNDLRLTTAQGIRPSTYAVVICPFSIQRSLKAVQSSPGLCQRHKVGDSDLHPDAERILGSQDCPALMT
jgi:hypothetical protein